MAGKEGFFRGSIFRRNPVWMPHPLCNIPIITRGGMTFCRNEIHGKATS